jgi:hypothetical protein
MIWEAVCDFVEEYDSGCPWRAAKDQECGEEIKSQIGF